MKFRSVTLLGAATAALMLSVGGAAAQTNIEFIQWWEPELPPGFLRGIMDDFEAALWSTVSGLGDRDTTCAIVGGIVALSVGYKGIPEAFSKAREPLDSKATHIERHAQRG